MTTATPSRSNSSDKAGQVMTEAARRMLPVLATKVLGAAADRAVDSIDRVTDRLGDIAENGLPQRVENGAPPDRPAERKSVGTVVAFVVAQAKALLDLVMRLLAQAATMLHTATERLRRRRAPEGIDEEDGELDDIDDDERADA